MTARRAELLSMIATVKGGVTIKDLAARIGLSDDTVREHLRKLRKLGLVLPTRDGGRGAKWTTIAEAETLRTTGRQVREREHERRRYAARVAAAQEAFERGPNRTITSAADCPPARTRAPNSVFNLAAIAEAA